ncbi:MAG TPA: DEAD/DEAH box helicase [Vicinamibacterales bacterium]|nr:DEAD/DEAH box helicase [Vicinamibacterales bacterium]
MPDPWEMDTNADGALKAGMRVRVRGDEWTVVSVTPHIDCQSMRLEGSGAVNRGQGRTLLRPFDRPTPVAIPAMRAVTFRRWRRHVCDTILRARPFGSLTAAARARIELMPFQLEPALAILRHGRLRVLVADEVGLGKTIQAGVMLGELADSIDGFRAIVVAPAGLREQWRHELGSRFSLQAVVADSTWLAERTRDLPADVNPWSLPGLYIASLDLVKRPEVLRALEDVTWDAAVIDEVHGAGIGTARLAAAHALGCRSRRVLLLTATPPDGDPAHLDAVMNIGALPGSAPITEFRRSRAAAGVAARRKTVLLPVRLSGTERRMHRLLEGYTSRVWEEAAARQDARGRLAAVILRKRALSGAGALALSIRRRLALLGTGDAAGRQLLLPLHDEDPLDDRLPDDVLAASGLADVAAERASLEAIAALAEQASGSESKLTFLNRLLRRVDEPVIVFTEYRDTLAHIASRLSCDRSAVLLHGEMTPRDRAEVQRAFATSSSLLLATDAASEGLNLHERCRIVVHFELPWTPVRLEQRTGRVDRLGQRRTVHEVLLIARDTSERLVLVPLLRRARQAATRRGAPLMTALTESAAAAAVMEGMSAEPGPLGLACADTIDLRAEAATESGRLAHLRSLAPATVRDSGTGADITITFARKRRDRLLVVVHVGLEREDGRTIHAELVIFEGRLLRWHGPRSAAAAADLGRRILEAHGAAILEASVEQVESRFARASAQWRGLARVAADRERAITSALPSPSQQLVQAGLFDRRSLVEAEARRHAAACRRVEASERLGNLLPEAVLQARPRIVAMRVGSIPR